MDFDAIVIGGGYAGLSAAALLAREEYYVLLLEQSKVLGGRASYMEKDGYTVEYGLHANRFASDGAAAKVFSRLGKELEFIEPGDPELWLDEEFVPLPNSVGKILRSKILPFSAKLRAARYLASLVLGNADRKNQLSMEDMTEDCKSEEVLQLIEVLSGIGIIAPDLRHSSAGELAFFLKKAKRTLLSTPISELAGAIAATIILILWGREVMEGNISFGAFGIVMGSLMSTMQPLKKLSSVHFDIQQCLAAGKRIYEVLDEEVTIKDDKEAVRISSLKDRIVLDKVWFKYEQDSDYVLKDINLEVEAANPRLLVPQLHRIILTLRALLLSCLE